MTEVREDMARILSVSDPNDDEALLKAFELHEKRINEATQSAREQAEATGVSASWVPERGDAFDGFLDPSQVAVLVSQLRAER